MPGHPYSSVIVGFDGSPQSEDALALGRVLAGLADNRIVLTFVTASQPPFERQSREYGQAKHARLHQIFGPAIAMLGDDVAVESAPIESSSDARGLYEVAASYPDSLLVIGSTHRGAVGRVVIGGVGEALLSGSPCPVAVAPRGFAAHTPEKISSIGVGFDGSEQSRWSLRTARAIASAAGATLRAIAVVGRHDRDALEGRLEETLAGFGTEGVEAVVLEGDPTTCLRDAGRDLDLLVVGSRGYGPRQHVLLGSVSTKLMRSVPCPVLVSLGPQSSGAEVPGGTQG